MTVPTPNPVAIGDTAPDFTLPDRDGTPTRLSELRRPGGRDTSSVLFFYPCDFTPACTREACSFRDSYEEFIEAGAVVIGVSADSPASHAKFASSLRLPYMLLSDADGVARTLYGVPKTLGVFRGRVTYVIDAGGIVRMVFNSQLRPAAHVRKAIELLRALNADGNPAHQSVLR